MKMRWLGGILIVVSSSVSWSGGGGPAEAARQDLAKRLQIPVAQVTVLSETEKDWPDASVGCPREGMVYAQVITNGSQLVLEVAGRSYFYHARAGRAYFYCDQRAKKSGAPSRTPRDDI